MTQNKLTVKSTYRYETKYLLTVSNSESILINAIKRHPACFREIHSQRRVNSVYFDTVDFTTASDNIAGIAERLKVRVRWYGKIYGNNIHPFLELKSKKGLAGRKDLLQLDSICFESGMVKETMVKQVTNSSMSEGISRLMLSLQPSIMTSYVRRYFLSRCTKYRLTLDIDIEFYSLCNPYLPATSYYELNSTSIMEIKYSVENAVNAHYITSLFPFRISKSSKYVIGINQLATFAIS
jgi:hypothetical protein